MTGVALHAGTAVRPPLLYIESLYFLGVLRLPNGRRRRKEHDDETSHSDRDGWFARRRLRGQSLGGASRQFLLFLYPAAAFDIYPAATLRRRARRAAAAERAWTLRGRDRRHLGAGYPGRGRTLP